jgi:hypothetical protein
MKGGDMKYLLFIVLLIAVIITAGCVGGNQYSVVTPTPQIVYVTVLVTPTPTLTVIQTPIPAQASDHIIGTWRLSGTNGYDNRIRFNPDGTFQESMYLTDEKRTVAFSGTWSAQSDNSYILRFNEIGISETYIFDLAQNAIYNTNYPHLFLTPFHGGVIAADTPQPTSTSSTTTPTSIKISGNGDDTREFSVIGSGGFLITGAYVGKSNFIVHITDRNGDVEEYVFNEIGSYSGRKIVHLDAGKHYLEVQAEGGWAIIISST